MSLESSVEVEHTETRTWRRSRNVSVPDSEDSAQAIISLRGTQAPGHGDHDVLQLNRDYDPAPVIREVILTPPPSDSYHGPAGGSALGGAGNQNVFNNHYYAQNPVPPGSPGPSPPTVPNPIEWNDARRCESAAETYIRMLLTKRIGYPLWTPEPSDDPPEYEEEGIRIGDVGIVDSDGQFDFLFNVCLPADHPINRQSPPSMLPFTFDPNRVRRRNGVFESDTVIASESVRERLIHSQTGHEDMHYPCEFKFSCSAPEGAVLVLPNGASRTNLRRRQAIQEYARQHVLDWYEHVYRTLGLEVEAGPLYLITGFDKCENWCLGSYVNIPAEVGVSLSFVPTNNNSSGGIVRYLSRSSGAINRRTFSPRDHNSVNQCVFIRGYKMMLSKSLTEKIKVGPVKISDIIPSGTGDRINDESGGVPGLQPFGRLLSWLTGGDGHHPSNRHQDVGPLDRDIVQIEAIPGFPEFHHPSDVINSYLLDADPSAQIAIMHDDDWCSVVEEKDTAFPDGPELFRRILEKYCPVQDAGCVTLVQTEYPCSPQTPVSREANTSPSEYTPLIIKEGIEGPNGDRTIRPGPGDHRNVDHSKSSPKSRTQVKKRRNTTPPILQTGDPSNGISQPGTRPCLQVQHSTSSERAPILRRGHGSDQDNARIENSNVGGTGNVYIETFNIINRGSVSTPQTEYPCSPQTPVSREGNTSPSEYLPLKRPATDPGKPPEPMTGFSIRRSKSMSQSIPENASTTPETQDQQRASTTGRRWSLMAWLKRTRSLPQPIPESGNADSPVDDPQVYASGSMSETPCPTVFDRDAMAADLEQAVNDPQPQVHRPNGPIQAGNLIGLVKHLISDIVDDRANAEYRDMFLTTYDAFTTADKIYQLLVEAYHEAGSLPVEEQAEIRFKIVAVMKHWVAMPRVLDLVVLSQMKEFMLSLTASDQMADSVNELMERIGVRINAENARSQARDAAHFIPPSKENITPRDLANAMTILEGEIYGSLFPADYLRHHRHPSSSTNIAAAMATNRQIITWVKISVLKPENYVHRAEAFRFFINTALGCRKLGNFSSMAAIVTALQSSAISRLIVTREEVKKEGLKQLETLAGLVNDAPHHRPYQVALDMSKNSCVPWIAVHLLDLENLLRKHPPVIKINGRPLISLVCAIEITNWIKRLSKYRPPSLQRDHYARSLAYLENQLHGVSTNPSIEDELERRSHILALAEKRIYDNRTREHRALGLVTR